LVQKLKYLITKCASIWANESNYLRGIQMELTWAFALALWLYMGASVAWLFGNAVDLDDSSDRDYEDECC
jgi:hypothetical protein